jgi:hypothetical protein
MADSTATPVGHDDERQPYEAPALTRHEDWEIVTGTPISGQV